MSETQPIDVRDMAIVHRTFDRMYAEAARLVRAAKAPTPDRVGFLADYIDFGVMMLHHHHESEDEMLYPVLIARAPEQASTTEEVDHEHELVKSSLEVVSGACGMWRRDPSQENGEALARSIDELSVVLGAHAKDEEEKVVPLAAVTLSQQEWDTIGERAVAKIPRKWKPVAFGLLVEPLNASDSAHMKGSLPAPVRLLYPILIDRPWKSYASKLRSGT